MLAMTCETENASRASRFEQELKEDAAHTGRSRFSQSKERKMLWSAAGRTRGPEEGG